MPTQEQRRHAARKKLLDATTELVSRGGFLRASVAEIGDAAGMSRGAVNFHFGSKPGLLQTLLQVKADEWSRQGPAASYMPRTSMLEELDVQWRRWSAEHSDARLVLMLIYEASGPSPELRAPLVAERARLLGYVLARLTAHQRSGGVRHDADLRAAAELIVGSLLGLLAQLLLDDALAPEASYASLRAGVEARLVPTAEGGTVELASVVG